MPPLPGSLLGLAGLAEALNVIQYFAFGGAASAAVRGRAAQFAAARRIALGRAPRRSRVRAEIAWSLVSLTMFGAVDAALLVATRAGMTRMYGWFSGSWASTWP